MLTYLCHKKRDLQYESVNYYCTIECISFNSYGLATITDKEKSDFSRHLMMAVGFGEKMVAQKQIPNNNPIHIMLTKLSDDLTASHGDLSKMIKIHALEKRIERYGDVSRLNEYEKFAKLQVLAGVGDCKEAEKYIIRTRQIHSGLMLAALHPTYSMAWIGEVQTKDRIDFMKRNQNYPLDEEAKKDYIAFFIYQLIFASRIPHNSIGDIDQDMVPQ